MRLDFRMVVVVAVTVIGFLGFLRAGADESGQSVNVTPTWISGNLVLPKDCPAYPQGLLSDPEIPRLNVYPLGANQELLELTCEVYVYQASMAYFVAPAGFVGKTQDKPASKPLRPLSFQMATPDDGKSVLADTSFLVGVPQWISKTGKLRMLTQGRGLADCGYWHQWRFDGQSGRFVLEEARGRECTDSTVIFPPPEQWPLLYADPSLSPQPEKDSWVTVGSLITPLDDVGCALTHRETVGNFPQIFKHGPDGPRMNLNDQERLLEEAKTDPYSEGPSEFRWENVIIQIDYGEGTQHEGGMNYPEATITVNQNGRKVVIPAKGGCGC